MRKLLLASTAVVLWAGAAAAADLPRRVAPVVYAPVPVFTWTGFYAGVNAGYGFTDSLRTADTFAIPFGAFNGLGVGATGTAGTLTLGNPNRNRDGFVGGGQAGFNYQFTPGSGFVIGYETDIQYADFARERARTGSVAYTVTAVGAGAAAGVGVGTTLPLSTATASFVPENRHGAIDYFGTVRGRLGYAFDRTLVYGTGGFAYGSGDTRSLAGFRDEYRYGYAAGGGVEYAFTDTISAKIEGLYVNLDERRRNFACCVVSTTGAVTAVPATATNRQDNNFVVVRAGLNVRLGERGIFGLFGL